MELYDPFESKYYSFLVKELVEKCKEAGIPHSGNKSQLCYRLDINDDPTSRLDTRPPNRKNKVQQSKINASRDSPSESQATTKSQQKKRQAPGHSPSKIELNTTHQRGKRRAPSQLPSETNFNTRDQQEQRHTNKKALVLRTAKPQNASIGASSQKDDLVASIHPESYLGKLMAKKASGGPSMLTVSSAAIRQQAVDEAASLPDVIPAHQETSTAVQFRSHELASPTIRLRCVMLQLAQNMLLIPVGHPVRIRYYFDTTYIKLHPDRDYFTFELKGPVLARYGFQGATSINGKLSTSSLLYATLQDAEDIEVGEDVAHVKYDLQDTEILHYSVNITAWVKDADGDLVELDEGHGAQIIKVGFTTSRYRVLDNTSNRASVLALLQKATALAFNIDCTKSSDGVHIFDDSHYGEVSVTTYTY